MCAAAIFVIAAVSVARPNAEAATIRVTSREQLVAALDRARPGTEILLAPGTYRGGLHVRRIRGTEGSPIVIASVSPERPGIIEGGASGIHLSDVAFIELRDLVVRNVRINGINIDDGGAKTSATYHIALRRVTVEDVGDRGNHDGIKMSGVDRFLVDDCSISNWGKSGSGIDMVGCHDGVVTRCHFKHSDADFGNGVQTKGGSRNVTIRRCRFEHAGGRAINIGGSTGLSYFRPSNARYEAKDITVEDCMIIGSMAPIAFVGVDGAMVRFNTIYRPGRWAIRILQENQDDRFVKCRNVRFENNIVAFRSDELRTTVNIGPQTEPQTFAFKNNLWTCVDRPTETRRRVHLSTSESGGTYNQSIEFVDIGAGDLRLRSEKHQAGVRPIPQKDE